MKVATNLSMLIVTAVAVTSCDRGPEGNPPSGPSDVTVPARGAVMVRCPEFGESSRCQAFAEFADGGGDVTGLAEWSTGNPAIASVSSTGLVTAHAAGEVAIRASYRGVSGFAAVWVLPDGGVHGTSRTLQGNVYSLNGPLADVLMEILNGPNAGRKTTTGVTGYFYIDGLQDGQFTIRLSKPGYTTAEYIWSIPGGEERHPTLSASK
jgi:hypothetical protein